MAGWSGIIAARRKTGLYNPGVESPHVLHWKRRIRGISVRRKIGGSRRGPRSLVCMAGRTIKSLKVHSKARVRVKREEEREGKTTTSFPSGYIYLLVVLYPRQGTYLQSPKKGPFCDSKRFEPVSQFGSGALQISEAAFAERQRKGSKTRRVRECASCVRTRRSEYYMNYDGRS